MRIIKEFNLGHLKCTVFVHEGSNTLKIEDEYGAVSYKLKDLVRDKTDEIEDHLDLTRIKKEIILSFQAMRRGRDTLLDMIVEKHESEEEII